MDGIAGEEGRPASFPAPLFVPAARRALPFPAPRLQTMLAGMGPCKMPLPGFTKEACGVPLYGDLGTLDTLVTSAPEVRGEKDRSERGSGEKRGNGGNEGKE